MSIESNLKSIADSLRGIAEIQEETLRTIKNLADVVANPPVVVGPEVIPPDVAPGPVVETSNHPVDINSQPAGGVFEGLSGVQTETPVDNPKDQQPEGPVPDVVSPVTLDELKAFNNWLNEMADFLGADGGKRIFDVFKQHGIQNLPEIGDDRNKLNAIKTDVEALAQ